MRYRLSIDRLVNRLVPHYLAGRRFVLFVQSLAWPLQTLNDRFCAWARERRIEAAMTSQVFYFEWFLNRRFGGYLQDPDQRITLTEGASVGAELYFEEARYGRPFTLWFEGERIEGVAEEEEPRRMYLEAEEKQVLRASFIVCVPAVTTSEREMAYMLTHLIERYRLAGRTYLIRIDGKEQPNTTTP
ncbi:hypothetical protein [Alistipes sp. i18-0019-D1]|uniref:hypothetical protein n=1 Tax=Alistipes sp. i18-0019-D1 TaxID=3132707 RepID=UPI0020509CC3|nr:MAG TPA: hypothetical protein [Caudoviricetes sp.]